MRLMRNAGEGKPTQTKETSMVTSEEADSTVQLSQVEQCWKLRRPFFEAFDQDQHEDSRELAKMLLQWLIYPVENEKFLKYHTTLLYVCYQPLLCCLIPLENSGKENHCYSNVIAHIIMMAYSVLLSWIEY